MFVSMIGLGPASPLVILLISGLALACLFATLAVRHLMQQTEGQTIGQTHKVFVGLGVAVVTFLLWGSSTGHGGPLPAGGMTGNTYGGILNYITITSQQPVSGMAWSHNLTVHFYPLLATICLTLGMWIVIARIYGGRRMTV
ncbi:MAG: hypothetical protein AAGF95_15355 [Chloroflexota bacterium]